MSHSRGQAILSAIGDEVRLALLHRLMEGPASVSELVTTLEASQPNVSNHLAVLRQARLVTAHAAGRQRRYELANPAVASLVESILVLSDPPTAKPSQALMMARTCYDHLAGQLGVSIFAKLRETRAVRRARGASGTLTLTPRGRALFVQMGIELDALYRQRRRFAYECLDWTEKTAHLGGALGAALCQLFVERGWIERNASNRSVEVTPAGQRALNRLFEIDWEHARVLRRRSASGNRS